MLLKALDGAEEGRRGGEVAKLLRSQVDRLHAQERIVGHGIAFHARPAAAADPRHSTTPRTGAAASRAPSCGSWRRSASCRRRCGAAAEAELAAGVRRRAGLAGDAGQHRRRRSGSGHPGQVRRRLSRLPANARASATRRRNPERSERADRWTAQRKLAAQSAARPAACAGSLSLCCRRAAAQATGRRIDLDEGGPHRPARRQGPNRAARATACWAPVYGSAQGRRGRQCRSGSSPARRRDHRLARTPPYRYYDRRCRPCPPTATASSSATSVPAAPAATFNVTLARTTDGQDVQTRQRLQRDPSQDEVLGRDDVCTWPSARVCRDCKRAVPDAATTSRSRRKTSREDRSSQRFAFIEDVADMPDRWFGYDAVDVVVLATGSDDVRQAAAGQEPAPRRERPCSEWVRRGGKLVVSVGRNQQSVAPTCSRQMPLARRAPLPGQAARRQSLPRVVEAWSEPIRRQTGPLRKVEVAALPARAPDVRRDCMQRREGRRPATTAGHRAMRAAAWAASSLVAFDLDAAPFTDLGRRRAPSGRSC